MVSENEEVHVDFFELACMSANRRSTPALNEFDENDYEGEWLWIGKFLSMLAPDAA